MNGIYLYFVNKHPSSWGLLGLQLFPKRQILDSSKLKEFADDNFNLVKMAEGSLNGYKTLWEKEKLLFMSNFSISHSVFKRPVLQTCINQGLFWKGLTLYQTRRIYTGLNT